jgi:hypothetical protein
MTLISIIRLFSAPAGSSSMTPTMRKRRMMPTTEVVSAIIKSSSVPISLAEAQESVTLLTTLCPFFLKAVDITGQEWLEMPATVNDSQADKAMPESPTKPRGKHLHLQVPCVAHAHRAAFLPVPVATKISMLKIW